MASFTIFVHLSIVARRSFVSCLGAPSPFLLTLIDSLPGQGSSARCCSPRAQRIRLRTLRHLQTWPSNNATSSHTDVIDPSRTVRKNNGINELDQLVGRRSIASDAEKFSTQVDCLPVNRLFFPAERGIGLNHKMGIKNAGKGL